MALMRKVPSEIAELSEQERGQDDGPNRFAAARFELKLPKKSGSPQAEDSDADASDGEDPADD